jgi:hypothetical protein
MRNLLKIGAAAGLLLTLGAATAYAVPQNSPYATMVPPGAVDGYGYDNGYYGDAPVYGYDAPVEGRSAYVDPSYGYDDGYVGDGYETQYAGPIGGGFYYGGGRGGHFGGHHFGGGRTIHGR